MRTKKDSPARLGDQGQARAILKNDDALDLDREERESFQGPRNCPRRSDRCGDGVWDCNRSGKGDICNVEIAKGWQKAGRGIISTVVGLTGDGSGPEL